MSKNINKFYFKIKYIKSIYNIKADIFSKKLLDIILYISKKLSITN